MVVKDRGPKYFGRKPLEMGINWKFSWTAQPFGSKRRQDILDYLRSIKDEDRNYILINRRFECETSFLVIPDNEPSKAYGEEV